MPETRHRKLYILLSSTHPKMDPVPINKASKVERHTICIPLRSYRILSSSSKPMPMFLACLSRQHHIDGLIKLLLIFQQTKITKLSMGNTRKHACKKVDHSCSIAAFLTFSVYPHCFYDPSY